MRRVDETAFHYRQELRFGTFEGVWNRSTHIPPHHDPACWGCGDNPIGLHLPLPAGAGLTEYEAWFTFDERHQGGPGIAHGGVVSAALDEAGGLLATWYAFPTVTGRIFVRYRRPVPINTELLLTARLVDVARPPAPRRRPRSRTATSRSPRRGWRCCTCRSSTSWRRPRAAPPAERWCRPSDRTRTPRRRVGSSAAARELSSDTSGARSGVVCARSIRRRVGAEQQREVVAADVVGAAEMERPGESSASSSSSASARSPTCTGERISSTKNRVPSRASRSCGPGSAPP